MTQILTKKVLVREGLLLAFIIAVMFASPAIFGNAAPEVGHVALFAIVWLAIRFASIRFFENRRRSTS